MNWTNIKKKYPKVWELFVVFRAKANTIADEKGSRDGDIFKLRDLYDFFDEQGIIINVYNFFGNFWWDIKEHYTRVFAEHAKEDQSKTRTEAEGKAFEKAFKILEGEL